MNSNSSFCKFSFFLILLIPLSSGCNITYKIRNQFGELQELIHLPCGDVTLELIGKGNSKFTLRQRFNLEAKMLLNVDSIHVIFNGNEVRGGFKNINNRPQNKSLALFGINTLEFAFDLDEGVFEGDTIQVFGRNYFHCENQGKDLDTILYTFTNTFKIQGVNY